MGAQRGAQESRQNFLSRLIIHSHHYNSNMYHILHIIQMVGGIGLEPTTFTMST